jgi:hypothetical protein
MKPVRRAIGVEEVRFAGVLAGFRSTDILLPSETVDRRDLSLRGYRGLFADIQAPKKIRFPSAPMTGAISRSIRSTLRFENIGVCFDNSPKTPETAGMIL